MWRDNEFLRRLDIAHPIVQGPFGGGLSSVKLTAAVSNAGGLGSFGANALAPHQIGDVVAQIRALTGRPFAINLWVSDHDGDGDALPRPAFEKNLVRLRPYFQALGLPDPDYPARFGQKFDEQIEAVLEARPPAFSFVFGIPSNDILAECRRRGIVTMGTATTPREAAALDAAEVDVIVAAGFEAGGHRGSFIQPAEDSLTGNLALVPQIVDCVNAPVIAAGGIADGRGIVAALALGAQGVQIGTAFLACTESGASDLHRAKLFTEDARTTALSRAFTGRLARGIRNRFMDEMRAVEADLPPYPSQGWFMAQLRPAAVAKGRDDLISLQAGQSAALLRHTRADDLMRSLVADTEALLNKLGA